VCGMKWLCGIAVALMLSAVPRGSTAQSNNMPDVETQFVMRLALNDANHEWMRRLAATIDTKSGGRIKAELYPVSQLGSILRMIESTRLGSIQVYLGPPELFAGVDPRFALLSAAGLVDSDVRAIKLISEPEFTKAFPAIEQNKNLIGGSLSITCPRAFVMRTPLHSLADLKGKKIRMLAWPFQMEQVARLGATGVPMSLGHEPPPQWVTT
jgi:TRAP-type C4-dicarboxylate transport system substrate-binding protein